MASYDPPHVLAILPPRFFFAVSFAALIFFAIWTWLTIQGDAIPALDLEYARYWHEHDDTQTHPGRWRFMMFVTDLGGVAGITLLAVIGAIWQTSSKHHTIGLSWLGIIIGAALLNQGVKEVFQKSRPPHALRNRASLEEGLSYPSGHTMNSVVAYGLLAYALILPQPLRWRRFLAIACVTVVILGVGFSRMYLRAHWFSDVIGGFALGVAWLFLCLGWLEQRRASPLTA